MNRVLYIHEYGGGGETVVNTGGGSVEFYISVCHPRGDGGTVEEVVVISATVGVTCGTEGRRQRDGGRC